MDYNTFIQKYKLDKMNPERRAKLMEALDIVYCEIINEEAHKLLEEYYLNADDIFNTKKK